MRQQSLGCLFPKLWMELPFVELIFTHLVPFIKDFRLPLFLAARKTTILMPSTVSIVVSTDPPSSSQGAFTDVRADVFVEGTNKAIGNITGILINRQQIPNYSFFETSMREMIRSLTFC